MADEKGNELTPEELAAQQAAANEKPEGTDPAAEPKNPDNKVPYDRFKAKVDEANELKEKLAEYERQAEERRQAEMSELEREREARERLAAELEAAKAQSVAATKKAKMAAAGYSEEQVERYVKFVDGNDDESIAASLEQLKADLPPTTAKSYADPSSAGAGVRNTPKKTDQHEKGVSAFQRLKQLGRI